MLTKMPEAEAQILERRQRIIGDMLDLLGDDGVVHDDAALSPYSCDALTLYTQKPLLVALPKDVAEVAEIMSYAQREGVKIVPRGSGTSLSGGSLPAADAILLVMTRFNRILEVDYENQLARVQPGVTNLAITRAVEHDGFYYAPDPSSQIACSIGGNVAENSGGVHCLKYGLTTNNVLGVELVLMDGSVLRLGGHGALDQSHFDLLGVINGSEGLLGVVTEVTVRLLPKPETARSALLSFSSIEDGGACVASVIAAGIIPAGMEMMDRPAINAAEDYVHAGYPRDAEAMLIVELDGTSDEVDALLEEVSRIAKVCGATSLSVSEDEEERQRHWAGRKNAFPAVGRISPDYICMDGTIPRKHLAHVLNEMNRLADHHGLGVANVFHAGDGNLHPLILFDANKPGDTEKAEQFGRDILKLCVSVGGVLTGEHGVGIEKRDLMHEMFTETDLKQQQRVKCAFDPDQRLNPGKVFPVLHRCSELGHLHVHKGQLPHPDLPRF